MQSTSANVIGNETSHVLYSRGRLFDDHNYFDALQKLAVVTRRTQQDVEERILNGERKRLKSSTSLRKLLQLESKLKGIGLDVYIEVEH